MAPAMTTRYEDTVNEIKVGWLTSTDDLVEVINMLRQVVTMLGGDAPRREELEEIRDTLKERAHQMLDLAATGVVVAERGRAWRW